MENVYEAYSKNYLQTGGKSINWFNVGILVVLFIVMVVFSVLAANTKKKIDDGDTKLSTQGARGIEIAMAVIFGVCFALFAFFEGI